MKKNTGDKDADTLLGSWEESDETEYDAPPEVKMIQSVERFELNYFYQLYGRCCSKLQLVNNILRQAKAPSIWRWWSDNSKTSECIKTSLLLPL